MGSQPAAETWFIPSGNPATQFFRAVVPTWVKPSSWEVSDCYWLAYANHVRGGTSGGPIAATLAWVCRGANGPVTRRPEQPVTLQHVRAEINAAWAVGERDMDYSLEELCAEIGVVHYPVREVSADWANRVWRTLQWLRGPAVSGEPVRTPVPDLPARNADGAVATAEELYAAEIARDAWLYQIMEKKIELRNKVEEIASLSRQLDQLIAVTKRMAGVAA